MSPQDYVDVFHNIPVAYYEAPYEMFCVFHFLPVVLLMCLPAGVTVNLLLNQVNVDVCVVCLCVCGALHKVKTS